MSEHDPGHAHGAAEKHLPGHQRFGGLDLPEPEFADDDGSADPHLAEVLAAYERGEVWDREVVDALRGLRLMAPLVSVLDEGDGEPLPGEKDSHMASVSMVAEDGRRGLLAFTSVTAMAQWDPAARGIPSHAAKVAAAAREEGAVAEGFAALIGLHVQPPLRRPAQNWARAAISMRAKRTCEAAAAKPSWRSRKPAS